MKFHRLFVAVLQPLGILATAVFAVLLLLVALNASLFAEDAGIPYLSGWEAGTALWTLFGLASALLLCLLMTEFLLVARKRSGIVWLSVSLLLGIASNVWSLARYAAETPWYSLAVSAAASALLLAYYWRRYQSFG